MNNLGNKETMADNIRKYMFNKGVSRLELSKSINVPYTTVCDWINAKTYPRIDKIELMANYFHISKASLVESHYSNTTVEADRMIIIEAYSQADEKTKRAIRIMLGIDNV